MEELHNFLGPGSIEAMNEEALALLRSIDGRLIKMETLVDIHLGKDGTVAELQKEVKTVNGKIAWASGAAAVLMIVLDWVKGAVIGK